MKFVNLFLCSMKKGEKESRQRDSVLRFGDKEWKNHALPRFSMN